MDFDDVLALAKSGFSREEIFKIYQATPATPATPATSAIEGRVEEMLGGMNRMLEYLKRQSVISSQQPPAETAGDVLASIIAPPRTEG